MTTSMPSPKTPADDRGHFPRIDRTPVPYFATKEPPMLTIDVEREDDGRWIAEVSALPGTLAYGATETEARSRAAALALRVIADRMDNNEPVPDEARGLFALA
jgi:predicted RNase H-like HicB family nuclease